jgi:hypothetical protein
VHAAPRLPSATAARPRTPPLLAPLLLPLMLRLVLLSSGCPACWCVATASSSFHQQQQLLLLQQPKKEGSLRQEPSSLSGFQVENNTFCSLDHHQAPAQNVTTVAGCADHALSHHPGSWGFEWRCNKAEAHTTAASCIIFDTVADCGHFHRSSCGSKVYVHNGQPIPKPPPPPAPPPPPPATKPVYDVSAFEKMVPAWIGQYKLPGSAANFSFTPSGSVPHPYAASDVLHVLCGTGQLDTLSPAERQAYIEQIQSFQRPDGFFNDSDSNGHAGGSMWHAAGYVTAGLSILGAQPLRKNLMFERIAATPSLWEPTVHGLLHADDTLPPVNISSGCHEGYSCAQNIASLASWWIQTNASTNGLVRHEKFLTWYFKYLRAQTDPETGLWCIKSQIQKHGEMNCIGGSFHIDFVMQNVVMHPQNAPPGTDATFVFPDKVLNSSLALEKRSGGWTPDGMAYLNVDGMYQATRPSIQLGKARWDEVERSCDRLMALVTAALNDQAAILGQHSKVGSKTHNLPALVGAVAECKKQFPEMIKTARPWKACLDFVPYI